MRTFLTRFIPRQPGYPVEVGIVAGEVGQTMGLHDRDDQGITHEQLMLPAHEGCRLDQGRSDWNGLDPRSGSCATAWT